MPPALTSRRSWTADALRRKFGGAAVTRAKLLTPETRKPEALSAAKERDKK